LLFYYSPFFPSVVLKCFYSGPIYCQPIMGPEPPNSSCGDCLDVRSGINTSFGIPPKSGLIRSFSGWAEFLTGISPFCRPLGVYTCRAKRSLHHVMYSRLSGRNASWSNGRMFGPCPPHATCVSKLMSPVIEIALHLEPGGDGQNLAEQILCSAQACQAEVFGEQTI
jgi:hypothetical protein